MVSRGIARLLISDPAFHGLEKGINTRFWAWVRHSAD